MDKSLEERVKELEKKEAELEGQVLEQQKKINTFKFNDINNITFSQLEKEKFTW
ncbi:hypothetical protein [Anaerophilus nitritogenes]|uniref:hypothetical protein n=1 Tax=Anaerophilus nitritogenes TaxID=2498136 RepID=UPI0013E9AACD|nr:hypothetical protein [Anaerophilus nitritogenes]